MAGENGQDVSNTPEMPSNLANPAMPPTGASFTTPSVSAPAAPTSTTPGQPHARLVSMLQGLFLGIDSFAKAAATGGKEGGVQEVEQVQQARAASARANAQQQQELKESNVRIQHTQAMTNASIAQTQVLQHNAPLEYQQKVIENQKALFDLYINQLHIPASFAVPMVEGQDTGEHMSAINSKANGDLVNNTAMPVHDDKFGSTGTSYGLPFDALKKVNLSIDQAGPALATLQNQVDLAKGILGADDPQVKVTQGKLDLMKQGQTINGWDFYNFNQQTQAQLMSKVANKQAITEAQTKQSAAAKEASEATTAGIKAINEATNQALGQAEKRASIAKTNIEAAKAALEYGQEKREAADIAKPDLTGFQSQLTSKEYDKRYDAFSKSKQFQTLQTLQGSYDQFQDVLGKLDRGEDLTGADSVVALFNAIGISATPLAGKGFRINQSTVEEHAGARGVGQAAYQKLLSLKNGDVITPQQVKDYASIASSVYKNEYVSSIDEAHRQGLPADFMPKGGGRPIDPATAEIYAKAILHANPQLASKPAILKQFLSKTAEAAGWQVPP